PAVQDAVLGRCSMCHAAEPYWDGIAVAPRGVALDSEAAILAHAREIYLQAGRTAAMPPANVTYMEEAERRLITAWYEGATR
ncbi:MAG: cysteine desulfurase, partial [Pseudomonadota bacterium]